MKRLYHHTWLILLIIIISLGICFRLSNLGNKIYWVDEVATSMRVAGYTQAEITEELLNQDIVEINTLKKYQTLNLETPLSQTVSALTKSPEHSPLYFLLVRFWSQYFGSSIIAVRSLSVIFSLLILPCAYWLCWELFQSRKVGEIAVMLLSISPFQVVYAQEARPYSLWILFIFLSSAVFLKAIKTEKKVYWIGYSLTLILGLHTSLLSGLIIIAHGIYIIILTLFYKVHKIKEYGLTVSISSVAFLPWIIVILNYWENLQNNTVWMRESIGIFVMIAVWIYNIFIAFIESPISRSAEFLVIIRIIIDIGLLIIVCLSFKKLIRTSPQTSWIFIICLILVPQSILIALDFYFSGQSSTASRYMIPVQLGIQLTVAYYLTHLLFYPVKNSQIIINPKTIFAIIISIGICSNLWMLDKSPRYQKTRSLHNIPVTNIVNQAKSPLLIAEEHNILDLISLSQFLDERVKFKLVANNSLSDYLENNFNSKNCQNIFIVNSSNYPKPKIEDNINLSLQQVYQPQLLIPGEIHLSLWQVDFKNKNCLEWRGK